MLFRQNAKRWSVAVKFWYLKQFGCNIQFSSLKIYSLLFILNMIKTLVPLSWLPIRFGDEQYVDFFCMLLEAIQQVHPRCNVTKDLQGRWNQGGRGSNPPLPDFGRILSKLAYQKAMETLFPPDFRPTYGPEDLHFENFDSWHHRCCTTFTRH